MAMEQVEVPSRSYFIRWVDCAAGNTISWSIKPHKKSLNFGIFKHPGSGGQQLAGSQSSSDLLRPPPTARSDDAASIAPSTRERRPSAARQGDAIERLHAAGLLDVYWHGKCEAEKVATGTHQVKPGQGGMFALVFDNTFSKQVAKTATLVLLTYPSNAPPPASHNQPHYDSTPAGNLNSSMHAPHPSVSVEAMSIHGDNPTHDDVSVHSSSMFQTGVLKKRRRKKHQGYARRFFSLDFTSSTLSYYLSKESSALRGAIPLSLAAISANQKERDICIDSGAEIWHLKANSDREWEQWKTALERAAQHALKAGTTGHHLQVIPADNRRSEIIGSPGKLMEDQGWAGVEALVGRVAGVRDAVRRLADTAVVTSTPPVSVDAFSSNASLGSAELREARKPFWKRKVSGGVPPPALNLHPRDASRGKVTAAAAAASAMGAAASPDGTAGALSNGNDITMHLHALLSDLDSVVSDFTSLVAENKQRRWLQHRMSEQIPMNSSRLSMESSASDEFFDAEDFEGDGGKVVMVEDNESTTNNSAEDHVTDDEESGESEDESFKGATEATRFVQDEPTSTTEGGERSLAPLPLDPVRRRATVPSSTVLPPSLIGFLRKNVGKDLSTIAMPVSANEPTSLLQRLAEQLEYTELLDEAMRASPERGERLLFIAAFATSAFANCRIKERSIRKPFNPMLGETYELVREDKGYRFIAEKVSHRPVIMACHAESENWFYTQSPMPTQKFWGKSAELNTSGRVRVQFPPTGDSFSWTLATSFLRNIIAGEKYVEPVGTMTVHHENTGSKAVVTFKACKGMFAGRSEEVSVEVFDPDGNLHPLSLIGKWTEQLTLYEDETAIKQVWCVGDLVEQSQIRFGFTKFAAELNEITPIEEGKMAKTDSRLRPDQRMVENGQLDEAEEAKMRLEEAQRARRKAMDERGEQWSPRWFVKVREYAEEEVWRIKTGPEGYWEQRDRGQWTDVPEIF
ncbi:Oxysterol-binding protein 3 [Rhizina undulata]